MTAKLTGGTAAAGVVAYQDHADPNQFHYIPSNGTCILGETLPEYSARYWGIGPAYYMQDERGMIRSVAGAVFGGRAAIQISSYQRSQIISAIATAYRVVNPKLLPMILQNVKVQPIIGGNTLMMGPGSQVDFPKEIQLGNTFNFAVGSGNSLFASFVGALVKGNTIIANPSFGVNIYGDAQFRGEPWIVTVTADLSQVWSYTRRQFDLGVGYGWLKISLAHFEQIMMDLQRESLITLEFEEGTPDLEKYGRQLFEMGKEMLEAVNALTGAQEGFFKFEPNPDPPTSDKPLTGFSWPWVISLNGGYGESSIKSTQRMRWQKRIVYSGVVTRSVAASMTLAVGCNDATKQYFSDLGNPNVPCITQDKVDELHDRLAAEQKQKQGLLTKLYEMYILGDITEEEYYKKVAILNGLTVTEDGYFLPSDQQSFRVGSLTHTFSGQPLVIGLREGDIEHFLEGAL